MIGSLEFLLNFLSTQEFSINLEKLVFYCHVFVAGRLRCNFVQFQVSEINRKQKTYRNNWYYETYGIKFSQELLCA